MPWIQELDIPTCLAWAELEVLAQRVYMELRDQGVINRKGDPRRRLLDDYRRLRSTQIVLSRELGMTPIARQTLKAS
jgi:phage terminase small subunit